jgi:hypothetical protein
MCWTVGGWKGHSIELQNGYDAGSVSVVLPTDGPPIIILAVPNR